VKREVASIMIPDPGIKRNLFPPALFEFLLFFLILVPAVSAVSPAAENPAMVYGFKGYGVDQGLTSPSVTAIIQDLDGFLWVGTEDGFFRLEGERFRRFGKEDGLPANNIETLAFARPSGIWALTAKGIALWDGHQFRRPSRFGFPGFDDRPAFRFRAGESSFPTLKPNSDSSAPRTGPAFTS
jgi:ligand-binding sensor domain-containing protein